MDQLVLSGRRSLLSVTARRNIFGLGEAPGGGTAEGLVGLPAGAAQVLRAGAERDVRQRGVGGAVGDVAAGAAAGCRASGHPSPSTTTPPQIRAKPRLLILQGGVVDVEVRKVLRDVGLEAAPVQVQSPANVGLLVFRVMLIKTRAAR